MRPIAFATDTHVSNPVSVLRFEEWEEKTPNKKIMNVQFREDLCCTIVGFISLLIKVSERGFSSLVPGPVNSNSIENLFCQYEE